VDGRARATREERIAIIGRLGFLVDASKTFCGIAFVNETEKFGQIDRTRARDTDGAAESVSTYAKPFRWTYTNTGRRIKVTQ
jgi:hypothetical protein